MHEMSLCENLVEIVVNSANNEAVSRIERIYLEIGQLSCVEVDAMLFCFDVVAQGTIAAGAQLIIEQVPGQAKCHQCKTEFAVTSHYAICPSCEHHKFTVISGDQMQIKNMEVI
ncbi:MAG: hydrogenase maturation nickel metallochaperone HypA [Enterobacterales bacterium]|nr:hydrogenase maturation nickel metallochaperone HypA [Enterobacterales bacterium]